MDRSSVASSRRSRWTAVGAGAGANARRAGVGGSTLAITINEGATASAVAGLAIAASSENSARAELEAGKLVRVLPDWDFGSMEVNALFANGKTIKPTARAFADFPSGSSVLLGTAPGRASP
jgi:DNA-binding transcriptional LysR family regulator